MRSGPDGGETDWNTLKELYREALSKPPDERDRFLDSVCRGNAGLRSEVESLLAALEKNGERLEVPALELAARMLARSPSPSIQFPQANPQRGWATSGSAGKFDAGTVHRLLRSIVHRAPWWLYIIATIFAADCLLRTYCYVLGPNGFDFRMQQEQGRSIIAQVPAGSASDRAGIRPGDIVLALDGHRIERASDWRGIRANLETGREYRLDIERDGELQRLVYRMERVRLSAGRAHILWQVNAILLLGTALLIAFSRPYDSLPRIGALALATLAASFSFWAALPPGYAAIWRHLPRGAGDFLWIPNVCSYLVGPIILTFFVLFPRSLFRARWPWVIIWLPALCFLPAMIRSTFFMVYRPLQAYGNILPDAVYRAAVRLYGLYGLTAVAALAVNYFRLTDTNDRRRLRMLFVGGGAAVFPGAFRLLIWGYAPLAALFRWLGTGLPDLFLTVIFFLFPASFAYSVLRHRLLDIRVIIRQSVQYALTRGVLLSLVPVLAIILVVDLLLHGDQPLIDILDARGWVYAALGAAAIAAHSQRRRWGEAIDRRFFRERYDQGRLLRETAVEIGRARSFADAAGAVVTRIETTLHPEFAAVMQRSPGEAVFRRIASTPSDKAPSEVAAESNLIFLLRIRKSPLETMLGESDRITRYLPEEEIVFLRRARIDLIVPVTLSLGLSEALLVLGLKRSEEPYTRDDKDLLAAIASNLELVLARGAALNPVTEDEFEECPECGTCYDKGSERCTRENALLVPVHLARRLASRYRLERRLGGGGMGAVYEAMDEALARTVAVKVIREDRLGSPNAIQRFQREARVVAGFTHPNVVTVYDHGIEPGSRAFLVMERLTGATLRDELKSHERLDAPRTIRIFHGLCDAVEAAHRRHLIRRDLKPGNIFLARSGDSGNEMVKILDFGIAKFLSGGAETAPRTLGDTETGILVGTPGYMSPEQLLGESPAVSWDLWALAVTAYETLTGRLPFAPATSGDWRRSVLEGRFIQLNQYLPGSPARWGEFFSRSLARDPACRPCSAADFFRQLEQALA